jgi:hypothetical protein
MVYLKLWGRKKSLEGRMRPAGRTLAMAGIDFGKQSKNQSASLASHNFLNLCASGHIFIFINSFVVLSDSYLK